MATSTNIGINAKTENWYKLCLLTTQIGTLTFRDFLTSSLLNWEIESRRNVLSSIKGNPLSTAEYDFLYPSHHPWYAVSGIPTDLLKFVVGPVLCGCISSNPSEEDLRNAIKKHLRDVSFHNFLQKYRTSFSSIKHYAVKQLYLSKNSLIPFDALDISLFNFILKRGGFKLPSKVKDAIGQITEFRNKLAHCVNFEVETNDFEKDWKEACSLFNTLHGTGLTGKITDLKQKRVVSEEAMHEMRDVMMQICSELRDAVETQNDNIEVIYRRNESMDFRFNTQSARIDEIKQGFSNDFREHSITLEEIVEQRLNDAKSSLNTELKKQSVKIEENVEERLNDAKSSFNREIKEQSVKIEENVEELLNGAKFSFNTELKEQSVKIEENVEELLNDAKSSFNTELKEQSVKIEENVEELLNDAKSSFNTELKEQSVKIEENVEKRLNDAKSSFNTELKEQSVNIEDNVEKRLNDAKSSFNTELKEQSVKIEENVEERLNYAKSSFNTELKKQSVKIEENVEELLNDAKSSFNTELKEQSVKIEENVEKRLNDAKSSFNRELKEHSDTFEKNVEKCLKETIPKNIRDQHAAIIAEWEREDKRFTNTLATKEVIKTLEECNHVIVTGNSGTGKSSLIHHVALKLHREQGFQIIPFLTYGPADIVQYNDPNKRQVFIVDDICGTHSINKQSIDAWSSQISILQNTLVDNKTSDCRNKLGPTNSQKGAIILLISCRLYIYKDQRFQDLKYLITPVCNLMSPELALNDDKRMEMLQKYLSIDVADSLRDFVGMYDFFPLLCRLSLGRDKEVLLPLFSKPIDDIKEHLLRLQNENEDIANKTQNCIILMCVLLDNTLKEEWLLSPPKDKEITMKAICKECDVKFNTELSRKKILKQCDVLKESYLKKIGSQYSIIHDKIYDIAAFIYGSYLPDFFLRYASSKFIAERYRLENSHASTENEANAIVVSGENESVYFDRILYDLNNHDVFSLLHNKQLHYEEYRQKLINYCEHRWGDVSTALRTIELHSQHKKGANQPIYSVGKDDFETYFEKCKNVVIQSKVPLIEAAFEGYVDIVLMVLKSGCDINQTDGFGRSAVHVCALLGNCAVLDLLVRHGGDISKCNTIGNSPLHMACLNVHMDAVTLILSKTRSDVNKDNAYGHSPLWLACYRGNPDIVKTLIMDGANVQCYQKGKSPLACRHTATGHSEVAKSLIENKVDIKMKDEEGDYPLNISCSFGYFEVVKLLIRNKMNVLRLTTGGSNSLHLACRHGHIDVAKLLIESKMDVNQKDGNGCNPLHIACYFGHFEVVKLLICNKMDVSSLTKSGYNSLHLACLQGHTDVAYLMIKSKMDINQKDGDGFNPLHIACYFGHFKIVKLLICNQMDVSSLTRSGSYSLHFACRHGHMEVAKLLIESKMDINQKDGEGFNPLHIACYFGHFEVVKLLILFKMNVSRLTRGGSNSLHLACQQGQTEVAQLLIESKIDINQKDKGGFNPLHIVCLFGHVNLVQLLICDIINVSFLTRNESNSLHLACQQGHTEVAKLLIESKIDIHQKDEEGFNPLHIASHFGYVDLVQLLICNRMDVSSFSSSGSTSLHLACQQGHTEVTKVLIESKIDINQKRKDGLNPLHIACFTGHLDLVQLLIDNKVNLSECTEANGYTALSLACMKGHLDVVTLLLRNNTNCYQYSRHGWSPLHLAYTNGHRDIVQVLQSYGDPHKEDGSGWSLQQVE